MHISAFTHSSGIGAVAILARRLLSRTRTRASIAFLCWGLTSTSAVPAPLAKEACDALKIEQDALVTGGIKDELAKGADWAKANLKPQRMKDVARFIELEEQLNFRCGFATARLKAEEPPAEATAPTKSDAPAPAARPKPKSVARPPADPGQPGPAASIPADPPAKSQPKPPAKPKPKSDDAFRPSPPSPNADPFSRQLAPKG